MTTAKLKPGALLESYKNFIDWNAYYVDKTLFIQSVLENPNKVQLYTRPRRFGKTLALSTLRTFLEKAYDFNGNLIDPHPYFEGKKIMGCGADILSRMGQYPVIFLTLKDCGKASFGDSLFKFRLFIGEIFADYAKILDSNLLLPHEKQFFQTILECRESQTELESSLRFLTRMICKAAGIAPYILIDEYDVPLQYAYLNGYYDEMVSFIRAFFSSTMKTNDEFFEKAVLTGCMRVSKESIFTGFNNLKGYSIADDMDREYFGFTDDEAKEMLEYYDVSAHWDEIREWYDSYIFGSIHVFNPFSLVQCIEKLYKGYHHPFCCYWTNSSGNDMIRDLVLRHSECRDDLEQLLRGNPIYKPVYESITYRDLDAYDQNIWTFLYFTGYIKSLSRQKIGDGWVDELALVNQEIRSIFPQYIEMLFNESLKKHDLSALCQAIWDKKSDAVKDFLDDILFDMVSYHDSQESFYHGMMLGILSHLYMYKVKSNRESGLGRTDIVLYDLRKYRAMIFEFKWDKEIKQLAKLPRIALEQVRDKKYAEDIHNEGFTTVYAVGIGFSGKACNVAIEEM